MAIAYVQSKTERNTNPAFTSSVGNTNLIVVPVLIETDAETVSSVTDNKSNTYSQACAITRTGATRLEIWYAQNVTGGSSFTITVNVTGGHKCISIHEYSGVATSNAFDAQATALSTDSGNVTTAVDDELLFGFGDRFTTVGASGSGYTQRENFAFNFGHATQDKLAGAAGTYNSTWANTQSSLLATFRPLVVATGGSSRMMMGIGT